MAGSRHRPDGDGGRRLLAYANRLPVTGTRGGLKPAAGGLVSALRPALEAHRGVWVGWSGGTHRLPAQVDGLAVDLVQIELSRRDVEEHYHGFANRTLWPLLHSCVEQPVFERAWWRAYRRVNERFADAGGARADGGPVVAWVHDYHLMLLPGLLRERGHDGPIGFFLHVPFPAAELFARLPWREQVLKGLLGADVVTFHTTAYRDNFLATCDLLLHDGVVDGDEIVMRGGRRVAARANPISIDADDFATGATGARVERHLAALREQFAGRRLILGVDRLDYTKGILERLRAVEALLEQRPDLRGEIAFCQVAVPSRDEVREYRTLREDVEGLVGRINGRFTEPGRDVPVHYLYRGITKERLLAYYRAADVAMVTPLRDGMNLVAKEFAVAQQAAGEAGALVLSEFCGAAGELREALPCNPYDIDGTAGMIAVALELDAGERRRRLEPMAQRVHAHDVHAWVAAELDALGSAGPDAKGRAP